jgi:S-formylglutathione hydrolase FrmB
VRSILAWASVFFIFAVAVGHAALKRHRRVAHPAAVPSDPPARTVSLSCRSPALGGSLPALVYLPAGYGSTAKRYPVIYVLHGLPAGPQTYTASGFVAVSLAGAGRQAIVVSPQGARAPDSDPEYLDRDSAEDWPRAIAHDLTRCVDAQFRTIAKRSGRALVGFSAGGFGAMNIGLRNLATFGAVESWSGYFEATDPSGQHWLDLGSAAANAAAQVPRGAALARAVRRHPTFIGFYIGSQDGYRNFVGDNRSFAAALSAAGVRHTFAVYPGTHSVSLWEQQAPWWLGRALGFLAALRAA